MEVLWQISNYAQPRRKQNLIVLELVIADACVFSNRLNPWVRIPLFTNTGNGHFMVAVILELLCFKH